MKRSFLTGLGITDNEVIDKIINTYQASVTDYKNEIAEIKANHAKELEKLSKDDVKPKLDELQAKYDELASKAKADLEAKELELTTFKQEIQDKEIYSSKLNMYKENLIKDGANPKLVDLLVKATDINSLELDAKTNSLSNYADVAKTVKESYAEIFNTKTVTTGADNPIVNNAPTDKATQYRTQMQEALKNNKNADAIAIKMQAFNEGIHI